MPFRELNTMQLDTLKEVSNIGMGHAATALSQMIGQTIWLRVPHVTITEVSRVPDSLGDAEKAMVGITMQILGDARGNIMLLFTQDDALRLLCSLLGRQEKVLVMHEMAVSALKEVGNILASSYLSAMGNLLNKTLIPSVPMLACERVGAVVECVLRELRQAGELALIVETEFSGDSDRNTAIRGHFFLMPDPATLDIFLNAAADPHSLT